MWYAWFVTTEPQPQDQDGAPFRGIVLGVVVGSVLWVVVYLML